MCGAQLRVRRSAHTFWCGALCIVRTPCLFFDGLLNFKLLRVWNNLLVLVVMQPRKPPSSSY